MFYCDAECHYAERVFFIVILSVIMLKVFFIFTQRVIMLRIAILL